MTHRVQLTRKSLMTSELRTARSRRGTLGLSPLALSAGLTACFPSYEDRPWLVEDTRVLAIRSTPAESLPTQPVMLETLLASPRGPLSLPVTWHHCTTPRRVDERTGVTASCAAGDDLAPLGAPAIVPADACAKFGPNPPPAEGDELPRRPADPDPTGGYYLPVRALADGADGQTQAFGAVRIRCDLAGVTRVVFDDYQARYTMNESPSLTSLMLTDDNGNVHDLAQPQIVSAGEPVTLTATPTTTASEPFVVYRTTDSRLHDVWEDLHVSWFVSAGELDTGSERAPGNGMPTAPFATTWYAPQVTGDAYGWVVIRDARGGAGWQSFTLQVQ